MRILIRVAGFLVVSAFVLMADVFSFTGTFTTDELGPRLVVPADLRAVTLRYFASAGPFSVVSNSRKIRLYSSAQLDGSLNP